MTPRSPPAQLATCSTQPFVSSPSLAAAVNERGRGCSPSFFSTFFIIISFSEAFSFFRALASPAPSCTGWWGGKMQLQGGWGRPGGVRGSGRGAAGVEDAPNAGWNGVPPSCTSHRDVTWNREAPCHGNSPCCCRDPPWCRDDPCHEYAPSRRDALCCRDSPWCRDSPSLWDILCHGDALCHGTGPCHAAVPCCKDAPCHGDATCHRNGSCHNDGAVLWRCSMPWGCSMPLGCPMLQE